MSGKAKERPVRVGMISLGCAKNLVDAEIMLGTLLKDGVELTNDAVEADVVIVNTCSFIDAAQEESVDTILESAEVREAKNRGQGLIVSGCLPQRFREELPKLLPEVDAFMGIDQVGRVTEIVQEAMERRKTRLQSAKSRLHSDASAGRAKARSPKSRVLSRLAELDEKKAHHTDLTTDHGTRSTEHDERSRTHDSPITIHHSPAPAPSPLIAVTPRPLYIPDFATPRFRLTPRHFAYVKIAEGCNHPCSFCIIPRMRGSHRSRTQADIVSEAKALLADGVKELNLISQDSTYYGLDLRPNHNRAIAAPQKFNEAFRSLPAESANICSLLRELNALPGQFWIRLLYTHPAHWTDELILTMAECPKVARYVDIPLQHIHQNMLERMRRETSQEYVVDLLRRIRAGVPGIALRTTFIVGFPGETEEYFEALLDFIRETKFERLGVFAYSQEEGTRAGNMAGQVPPRARQSRRQAAMAAQHDVAVQVAESFVGRTLNVLVEKEAETKELKNARVHSWEHGLMRVENSDSPTPGKSARQYLVARGEADAPDIDGRVYIQVPPSPGSFGAASPRPHLGQKLRRGEPKARLRSEDSGAKGQSRIGDFAKVKIVGHTDYDLIAEAV